MSALLKNLLYRPLKNFFFYINIKYLHIYMGERESVRYKNICCIAINQNFFHKRLILKNGSKVVTKLYKHTFHNSVRKLYAL